MAVLEGPPHNVGLGAGIADVLGLGEGRPKLVEFLKLDEVPDKRDGGLDNGTLDDLVDEAEGPSVLRAHCSHRDWIKVWFC